MNKSLSFYMMHSSIWNDDIHTMMPNILLKAVLCGTSIASFTGFNQFTKKYWVILSHIILWNLVHHKLWSIQNGMFSITEIEKKGEKSKKIKNFKWKKYRLTNCGWFCWYLFNLVLNCMIRLDPVMWFSWWNRAMKFGQEYIGEIGREPPYSRW